MKERLSLVGKKALWMQITTIVVAVVTMVVLKYVPFGPFGSVIYSACLVALFCYALAVLGKGTVPLILASLYVPMAVAIIATALSHNEIIIPCALFGLTCSAYWKIFTEVDLWTDRLSWGMRPNTGDH